MGTTTVETPTPKSTARRTRADKAARAAAVTEEPVGTQVSTDSPGRTLASRLAAFGFNQNPDWSDETIVEVNEWLDYVEADAKSIADGKPVGLAERVMVTHWLDGWEAVTPDLIIKASEAGKKAAENIDMTSEHCPYPIDTALAAAWHDAFEAAVKRQERPANDANTADGAATEEKPVAVEGVAVKPTETNAEEAHRLAVQRASDNAADRERRKTEAIEQLRCQLEHEISDAAEARQEQDSLKSELAEVGARWKKLIKQSEETSHKLRMARQGIFSGVQLTFVDTKSPEAATFETVSKPTATATPAEPPKPKAPPVDNGAFVSIDHMVKGDLQEFIPGTPEDRGISQKQADNLKDLVGGDTIGHLEKWIKSKGDWWLKELKDSGKGFGKETVTKVQDAHEIIRRKFPIPDPDDVAEEPKAVAAAIAAVAPVPDSDPALSKPIDAEQAEEMLEKLIEQCEEVERDTTNLEGIRFVRSVKEQAKSMLDSLSGKDETTPDQARAIRNWQKGVSAWYERDLDEDELDIDEE